MSEFEWGFLTGIFFGVFLMFVVQATREWVNE